MPQFGAVLVVDDEGVAKSSDCVGSTRKQRADNCMDAAVRRPEGRTMHGAIVENLSVL